MVWFIYEFHVCDSSRHMTFQPASNAAAGMQHACPACDAQPGESCTDRFGRTRITTHQERKPKADD